MFGKKSKPSAGGNAGDTLWAQARELHEKGDEKKAFDTYLRAANSGSAKALNSVGVCYMTGFGLKKKTDTVKAVEFFQRGADAGNASAMLNLANAFAKGDGVEQNDAKAFEWYRKAAENGDDAQFLMAVALLEGKGTVKDPGKAYDLFAAAVEKDYVKAYNYLGVCHAQGFGGAKKDSFEAVKFFELATSKGDPRGMFNLAMAYQLGLGVDVDLSKSLELHLKAWSEYNHVDSLAMLGVYYLQGIAVLVDDVRAFEIFSKAAEFKHVDALNHLGMCYLNGRGTSKDPKKAFLQFKLSADLNHPSGIFNLANMYLNGAGILKDERKACLLFQSAMNLGSLDAMVSLALCYAEGTGVETDKQKAVELMTRASEKKNVRALFTRAQWLEQGLLVQRDLNESLEFYRKALLEGHKAAGVRYRELVLESLPESVKRGGKKQVERFVEDLVVSGQMAWNQAKIMVLGKEGVGKTALYHKMRELPYPVNLSTDGIDVHSFHLNGIELIWFDFGGQTIFYPTHQFFLTTRCIYLLCFKFGDDDSIERVKYWLQDVQYLTRDPTRPLKLVVVGTHADAMPSEEDQLRVWESLKPQMDSLGHVVGHIAVSSRDGAGFDGLKRGIELAIDAAKLRAMQVPKSYEVIETFIKEMRKEKPRMDWTEVRGAFPALSERHLQVAFDFFNDMGLCIYDQKLQLFVSDPQWLAKTFSVLVSFSQQWVKEGVVALQNLRHVWKGMRDEEIEKMMYLFEKFGVAFLKRKERCWVIPTLLSNDNGSGDEFEWSPKMGVKLQERVFKLEFIPYGLFGRLIARLQSWCEADEGASVAKVWRTGILLLEDHSKATAEITIDANRNSLVIRVMSTVKTAAASKSPVPLALPPSRSMIRPKEDVLDVMGSSDSKPPPPLPAKREGNSHLAASADALIKLEQRSSDGPPLLPPRRQQATSPRGSAPIIQARSTSSSPPPPPPPPRGSAFESLAQMESHHVPRRAAYSDLGPSPMEEDSSPPRSPGGSWSRASKPELKNRPSSPRSPRAGGTRLMSLFSRTSEAKSMENRSSFVKLLVEQVTGLLDAVFDASSGLEIQSSVACPHCLNDAKLFVTPTYFTLSTCIDAVVNAKSSVLMCKGERVSIDLLDDDVTFRYVTVFRDDEVELEKQPFAAGGFGNIYKGRFRADQRPVVAKELKPEKAKEAFSELQHETSVMSKLRHPNLLQLYGVMLQPLRMMLEYCGEGDLIHALRKGRINNDELRFKISLDIANGLCFLHEQKPPLAHRDLRSPNILLVSLDPKSAVCGKVCDFGLTMSVIERMRSPLPTWQWMAPEAQLGDYYTEACDLYSFGIVLFEIFDGKGEVPFSEFSAKMRMAEMFPLLRDGSLRPTLPVDMVPWMKSMIERLWSTVPSYRPSARQCVTSMTQRVVVPAVAAALSVLNQAKPQQQNLLNFREGRVYRGLTCCSMMAGEQKLVIADAIGKVNLIDPKSGDRLVAGGVNDACMLCVASPYVWIGRKNGLLCCINERTGEDSFLFVDNLEITGSVTWMACLSKSRLLVADDQGWICLIATDEGMLHPSVISSSQLKQGIICGCVINENCIWLGCENQSVLSVNIRDNFFDVATVGRGGSHIRSMIFVGGTEIWLLDEKSLRIYLQGKLRFQFPIQPSFSLALVNWHGERTVWIGQIDAIAVWDLKRKQVAKFDLVGFGKVTCMACHDNTVWIGSETDFRELTFES